MAIQRFSVSKSCTRLPLVLPRRLLALCDQGFEGGEDKTASTQTRPVVFGFSYV